MAVISISSKSSGFKRDCNDNKKHKKSLEKPRPITATLEQPLILDIKFLKRLDMTTFTKKGLIALSKFCGISLISSNDSKKMINKYIKSIKSSKKQFCKNECTVLATVQSKDSLKSDNFRCKKKFSKTKLVSKVKPRINLKIVGIGECREDNSTDVVCRKHEKTPVQKDNSLLLDEKKSNINDFNLSCLRVGIQKFDCGVSSSVITETCKTCNQSDRPERFHSHPRGTLKLSDCEKNEKMLKADLNDNSKNSRKSKTLEIVTDEKPEKLLVKDECLESKVTKSSVEKVTKSTLGIKLPQANINTKAKTMKNSLTSTPRKELKKSGVKNDDPDMIDTQPSPSPDEEAMRFVTGCYICGTQVNPKLRIQHEKECIVEWRSRNNMLSADKRKPEPRRPDYRFTPSGNVDFEGTFQSIWANHQESLIPCKKCGRRFFPERIERHENCCNNLPFKVKYKPK